MTNIYRNENKMVNQGQSQIKKLFKFYFFFCP